MAGELSRRLANTRRILDLERLNKKEPVGGKFEGTVVAYYKKKNNDGTITVLYNGEDIIARPQSEVMAVKNDIVNLTFRAGIYLANW